MSAKLFVSNPSYEAGGSLLGLSGAAAELAGTCLRRQLELSIKQRTGDRVQGLRVETMGCRVIVSGGAVSYHVLQLAISAVSQALAISASAQPRHVELQIAVGLI